MIEKLCEASIDALVDLHLSRKKENQLIEDVKTHFKEQLRDSLRDGRVAQQYVETVKKDVAQLSKEISSILKEDIYALTRLFEAVHDHAQKTARELDTLMAKSGRGKDQSIEDQQGLFTEVEKVLVSLVSDYRFELKPAIIRSETTHENILLEKRKELLDHVFELLQK
jgi:23S rRNA U2552 (ribose-2'-O)-methylase RlmE/FtsJ